MGLRPGSFDVNFWPDDYDSPYEVVMEWERLVDKDNRIALYHSPIVDGTTREAIVFPWAGMEIKISYNPSYLEVLKFEDGAVWKYQPRGNSFARTGGFERLSYAESSLFKIEEGMSYVDDIRPLIKTLYHRYATSNANIAFPVRSVPREILPDIQDFMRDPFRFPTELLKLDRLK